jgi:rhodanese-related sulfurtransferase
MSHTPGFLKAVETALKHVKEVTVDDVQKRLQNHEAFYFVDVREDSEWQAGRAAKSIHIGKGVIERDIENVIPNKSADIVLYCGGGYRSILAAESIQKMGYQNVSSMAGGIREWRQRGLAEESN